jgi:hypothetical protein
MIDIDILYQMQRFFIVVRESLIYHPLCLVINNIVGLFHSYKVKSLYIFYFMTTKKLKNFNLKKYTTKKFFPFIYNWFYKQAAHLTLRGGSQSVVFYFNY